MMWLLFHKAKKHVSGAVGVSPCAANSFFTGEVKRWEKTLQLTSYSGRPLSHTTLTGRGGFEEPFSSLGTVTQDRNYPLKEGNSRCMAPGLRWHKAAREAAERLRNQIYTLNKLGILNVVDPLLRAGGPSGVCRDPAFQRMECIGDHNWGHSICHRILLLFPEVNWRMQSNILAMHALRSMLESNQHLSDVFTLLQLRNPSRGTVDKEKSVKFKADVVEAIAGELRVALWSLQPTASDGITARPSLHGVPYTPILVSMIEESLDALIGLVILAFMSKWGTTVAAAVIELIRREQYVLHTSNIHYKLHGRPARRSQRGQATCCVLPQPPPLLHEKRALPLEQGRPETPVRKWIPSDLSSEDAGKVRSAHTQRENELPKIPSHPPLAVPCPTATEVFVGETVEYYKLTDLKQQS
uniref:Uncharacterized protein TCIL3000_11_8920 n=1 Tax=Trypanosoma congolense (strain IL3000) TaxID=1068625 RepID=G0V1B4_TRYCI|nr:unnamed protein product [Trypanosoma congolense IL3000]